MIRPENFGGKEAQEKLSTLIGTFAFPKDGNITEVNNLIEKAKFSMQIHSAAPQYVLTRALYPTEEGGNQLKSARFTVRPTVSHKLDVDALEREITINAGADFFDKFITEMAEWFDLYHYASQLQANVNLLNAAFLEVTQENELPITVQFSLGDGLLDATDTYALVGLSEDTITSLGVLPLFDEDIEQRVLNYKAKVVETLQQCNKAYDIVKVKSLVTKDLNIYSRKAVNKLIRQFVNRKIEFVRVGTGYVETDNTFAVVDKVAVTEDELATLDTSDALVVDNAKATTKEKEAGKTKILVSYRISPFNKEEGTPANLELAKVI